MITDNGQLLVWERWIRSASLWTPEHLGTLSLTISSAVCQVSCSILTFCFSLSSWDSKAWFCLVNYISDEPKGGGLMPREWLVARFLCFPCDALIWSIERNFQNNCPRDGGGDICVFGVKEGGIEAMFKCSHQVKYIGNYFLFWVFVIIGHLYVQD